MRELDRTRDERLADLRRELAIGIEQIDRGGGRDAGEVFTEVRRRMSAEEYE